SRAAPSAVVRGSEIHGPSIYSREGNMHRYHLKSRGTRWGLAGTTLLVVGLLAPPIRAQVDWTAQAQFPIFDVDLSAWDSQLVGCSSLLAKDGRYLMWYSGLGPQGWQIGCASSTDLVSWQPSGPDACLPIRTNAWDQGHFGPCVLFDEVDGV